MRMIVVRKWWNKKKRARENVFKMEICNSQNACHLFEDKIRQAESVQPTETWIYPAYVTL